MSQQSAPAEVRRFAKKWAAALKGAVAPAMTKAEVEALLCRLTAELADAVKATPFQPDRVRDVGAALVEAHYRDVESLNSTVSLLGTDFAGDLGRQLGDRQDRQAAPAVISALQGAFAEGFSTALRSSSLHEGASNEHAALAAARVVETRPRTSEARFQAVFAEAAVGIAMVDLAGSVIEVNSAFADMLGRQPERLAGRKIAELIGTTTSGEVDGEFRALLTGCAERFRLETACSRPDGRMLHLDLSMSMVRDCSDQPDFIIGVAVDVTERRRLEDRLWHDARHDALTGLPNRKRFLERLTDACEPYALCYLDLDGFANVNDSLGHDTGDRLLIAVAQRLRTALEAKGCTIARLGGDEFGILVECAGPEKVTRQADRALATLERPFTLDGTELTVSGCMAVVHTTVAGSDASHLMRAADITMHRAKARGKGRQERYDPAHGAEEVARHSLATELPQALSRREFFLDYQPLVDLAESNVRGFEALVRWRSPSMGLLSPDRFIPVAEETGHILELGKWVLEESCRQARRWYDEFPNLDIYVSVNVAATQLREPTFVADVLSALDNTGLSAELLQLELTESAVAGDTPAAMATLRELAAAGVGLAIDDFGTGYSNLAHLGRLPVHRLKIDRSFLTPVLPGGRADPAHDKIVAATISLAHSLGLSVAAEGVETAAQAERLRALHCDSAQGLYFGGAASATEASRTISRGIPRATPA